MPKAEALRIPALLAAAGTQKLTFVGGEPTLCPYLPELVAATRDAGITAMIVTNATLLSHSRLEELRSAGLDWLGVSIDSFDELVQQRLGRGHGKHVATATRVLKEAKLLGLKTKLNTVITRLNWEENMEQNVRALNVDRWKIFRVLLVQGENDDAHARLSVTRDQFAEVRERYRMLARTLNIECEDNEDMTSSYIMLDAAGRFFQNAHGSYVYGRSVLDVGVQAALGDIGGVDLARMDARGAFYPWRSDNPP